MGRRPEGSRTWGCPGWKSPWHSVLLAASVFSSCFLLSQAARSFVPVVADPEKPVEGGNVTLIPQGAMNDSGSCGWYRGVPSNVHLIHIYYGPPINVGATGPAYTDREKILPPLCSLHMTNLTTNDSATYFVTLDKPGFLEIGGVELEVLGTPPARGGGTGGFPKGAIAGIVVGGALAATFIAGVSYYYWSTRVSH